MQMRKFSHVTSILVAAAHAFSPHPRCKTAHKPGISPAPTYDKNGNQLTSTPATLTWDALNQPATVNSTSATYDALGRMVETGVSGVYKQFVFLPSGDLLAVYSSGLVKGTLPLPGGETAVYNASGLNFIRHKDWLGSSRLATTWTHTVYSKTAYAPFGETYNEAGSTPDRSFTGQDQNMVTGSAGSGVYDYLFRKYDPSAGRWLSPDPLGWGAVGLADPQSLDRYAYVENDPLRSIDPTGLDNCVWDDGTSDDSAADGGDTAQQCIAAGGTWYVPGPSVDVNGNTNEVDLSGGQFPGSLGLGQYYYGNSGSQGSTGSGFTLCPFGTCLNVPNDPNAVRKYNCEVNVVINALGAALGAKPPGSDPAGETAEQVKEAAKNPVVQVTVATAVGRVSARLGVFVGDEFVPFAGQVAGAYIIVSSAKDGIDSFKEYIGKCK